MNKNNKQILKKKMKIKRCRGCAQLFLINMGMKDVNSYMINILLLLSLVTRQRLTTNQLLSFTPSISPTFKGLGNNFFHPVIFSTKDRIKEQVLGYTNLQTMSRKRQMSNIGYSSQKSNCTIGKERSFFFTKGYESNSGIHYVFCILQKVI